MFLACKTTKPPLAAISDKRLYRLRYLRNLFLYFRGSLKNGVVEKKNHPFGTGRGTKPGTFLCISRE
jgi:hypothetical protein